MASVCSLFDPRFEPHPAVFDDAVLLHHDRVGALRHRGAGEDPDCRAAFDGAAERVTRCGSAQNRKHCFPSRHETGVGESIAVDGAVGVRRQVHRSTKVPGKNTPAGAAQRRCPRLHYRCNPLLDPAERGVDAQQGASKSETIIAQLCHPRSPAWCPRMKLAIAPASDNGSQGLENSGNR